MTVSPAQAGMDPWASLGPRCTPSFPRTGGDGPFGGSTGQSFYEFPPHRRGWTGSLVLWCMGG